MRSGLIFAAQVSELELLLKALVMPWREASAEGLPVAVAAFVWAFCAEAFQGRA